MVCHDVAEGGWEAGWSIFVELIFELVIKESQR